MPRDALEDLTKKNFGDIKPTRYLGKKYWECKCKCGEILKIRKSSLKRHYANYECNHKKSAFDKALKKANFIDLSDMKFGDLSIVQYEGKNRWQCKCICGYEKSYESNYLRRKLKTYKCSHNAISKDDKFIDLTNKQLGDLYVTEYVGNSFWKCTCKCKREYIKHSYYIRNNENICRHNNISEKSTFIDMSGQQFGDVKVTSYLGDGRWECECSCGYTYSLHGHDIRRRLSNYKCRHEKIVGERFGKVKVIKKLGNRKYLCECDCGSKPFEVFGYNLIYGNTKSCGCVKSTPIMTKEQVEHKINQYINNTNQKPMLNQLSSILGLGYNTSVNYVKRYNLYTMLDGRFRSSGEKELYNILKDEAGFDEIVIGNRNIISNNYENELDFYIPEINTAIEFNGTYWHSDKFKDKFYHQRKTIACAKQGIRLIHIFEYELFFNEYRNKIIGLLKDLKASNKNKIYARNTFVTEELDINTLRIFENDNHIQGYVPSVINVGIITKDANELVGIMTFGTPRFSNTHEYELIRLCFKKGYTIVGGAEKMYKHFIEKYNPESVLTYCDISKFTGNIYTRLGFKATENSITEPSYCWVDCENEVVLSRYQTQKHKLVKKGLTTDNNETEDSIMSRLGYIKVFNSGNLKLEWKNNI